MSTIISQGLKSTKLLTQGYSVAEAAAIIEIIEILIVLGGRKL